MKAYSFDFSKFDERSIAKARLEGANISFKDASAVCDNIRGKSIKEALLLLERVIKRETPILYRTHNKKMGHRKELGGKKGRWPIKESKTIRKLLLSLLSNALNKGLNEDSLIIIHASANKKRTFPKLQPSGRRIRHDYELARVEVVAFDSSFKPEKAEKPKQEKQTQKQEKQTQKNQTQKPEAKQSQTTKQATKQQKAKEEKKGEENKERVDKGEKKESKEKGEKS